MGFSVHDLEESFHARSRAATSRVNGIAARSIFLKSMPGWYGIRVQQSSDGREMRISERADNE
jgi:hypothetical protein